jgi:hypothetical protein
MRPFTSVYVKMPVHTGESPWKLVTQKLTEQTA